MSEDKSKIVEQNLETEQQSSEQILESTEQTLTEDETKSQEQKIAMKDNQETSDESEGKDNIESKIENEILSTDNKNEISKKPIKQNQVQIRKL